MWVGVGLLRPRCRFRPSEAVETIFPSDNIITVCDSTHDINFTY